MSDTLLKHKTEDFSLPSSDGESSIFVRVYKRGKPRLHFLLVHGALEHSGRHIDLVNFWLRQYQDVQVTVFDSIGHGRSGGSRAYLNSFTVYVDDLYKVGEFTETMLDQNSQTFICAHSLGGLITLTRFLDTTQGWPFPISGILFSSPSIKPWQLVATDSLIERLDRLTPKLHIPMIYKGKDLTRDIDRANDFDLDSLIPRFITVRMIKQILEASQKVRGLSYYLKVPSLFMIAGKDVLVDPESTTLFAHGIDKNYREIIQYPEHHHELWNETDREEIFGVMKKWVEKQLKEKR